MKEFYDDDFFEQLSTERLEEMIDLGMELPASENRKALLRILEVLEERENDVDVEKAWEEFQMYYNIPEGSGIELYETGEFPEEKEAESARTKKNPRVVSFPRLRAVGRVAVVAAVTFVLMITTAVAAQAAGYDVFGALGRWTNETFRFEIAGDNSNMELEKWQSEFQASLVSAGIDQKWSPSWYPTGFEPGDIELGSIEGVSESVSCSFDNEQEDRHFVVSYDWYFDPYMIEEDIVEKDSGNVEQYEHDGKDFYIMSNLFGYTAVWVDGPVSGTISGNLTQTEIKNIIDSIGGK